jgi:lipopolysaccharide transport system ATP-binding protein
VVFDVLEPGHILVPALSLSTEAAIVAFCTFDLDPEWRGRSRPVGRFISTAWVPANFLAEGTLLVNVNLFTPDPHVSHFYQADAIAFQAVDNAEGDSARGDWDGNVRGVVRPLLKWTTEFHLAPPHAELGSQPIP